MKKLKINYLNNQKLEKSNLNQVRGGTKEKLCLNSCQLGANQEQGDIDAHNALNPA